MKNKKLKLIVLAGVTAMAAVMLTGCGNKNVKNYDKDQVNIAEITEQNNVVENTTSQNNNQVQNNKDEVALKAIAAALKDDKWIDDNIKFKQNSFGEDATTNVQEIKFLKLGTNVSISPAYLVENHLVDGTDDYKIFLLTYQDNKVDINVIVEGRYLSSATSVDANNGILYKNHTWMGTEEYTFYKINGIEINQLDNITKETIGEDENNIIYYNWANECTKEDFDSVKSKYNGYNFVGIKTYLSDENIDKYIYKVESTDNIRSIMTEDEIKDLYLKQIKKEDSENSEKLLEYRVDEVSIVTYDGIVDLDGEHYKDTDILAIVTYSVKPQDVNNTVWAAGNGGNDGEWIVNKSACVCIRNGEIVSNGINW